MDRSPAQAGVEPSLGCGRSMSPRGGAATADPVPGVELEGDEGGLQVTSEASAGHVPNHHCFFLPLQRRALDLEIGYGETKISPNPV